MKTNFSRLIHKHFTTVGMNPYRLAKETGMHEQYVYKICRGEQRPSDEVLLKFAAVGKMKISAERMRGWRALDDYSCAEMLNAIEEVGYKHRRIKAS